MKVRIERNASQGQVPTYKVTIDGVEKMMDYEASRLLTGTTGEDSAGVFEGGRVDFWKNEARVKVNFGDSNLFDLSASDMIDELRRRVDLVSAAFAEKYPAINEIAEREF